jgi:hypothetical protein
MKPLIALTIVLMSCDTAELTNEFHSTDWSEHPTGRLPRGFSPKWDKPANFIVVEDPDSAGNKFLQWSSTDLSRNRWGLAFDRAGRIRAQEVYTEVRTRTLGPAPGAWFMGSAAVRMAGDEDNEGGYAVWFLATDTSRKVVLNTWAKGVYKQLAAADVPWELDEWYSVRLRAVGRNIQAKVWPRSAAEPQQWLISADDGRWPKGKPGIAHHENGITQWDKWAVTVLQGE